jgi:CBS domain-containing protein
METQSTKNTKRLTIYIGESDLWRGKALYMVLLETMRNAGLAGATVTRGIAGFGARSRIHTAAILRLSEDLPLVIEVIDSAEKIEAALETIYPMVREGMITLEDVQVLKYTHRDLNPLPGDRLVKEVMSTGVKSISPTKSIAQAWKMMINHRLKALPVVNDKQEVVGMLTDEDLIERAGLSQRFSIAKDLTAQEIEEEIMQLSQSEKFVKDVMSKPAITIPEEYSLNQAVTLMKKHHLKRIPVVDKHNKLSGMLSRFDILRQIVPVESNQPAGVTFLNTPKTVSQIMSPEIPLVSENDNLEKMIEAFLRYHSHRLIVVDDQNRVIGILSDADIVNRLPYKNKSSIVSALRNLTKPPTSTALARDLMSREPLQAEPDLPIPQAIQMMMKEGRKILVIIDKDKHPIGMVDRQSLLEALINIPKNID